MKSYNFEIDGMAKSQLYGNGEYIKEIDAMYALTVAILQVGFSFTNTAKVGDEFEIVIQKDDSGKYIKKKVAICTLTTILKQLEFENSDILEIIDKFENIINS